MKNNVGQLDKIIRFVLGVALIAVAYYLQIWWLLVLGLIVMFTATFSWCGLYTLIGVNTCKVKK